MWEADKDDLFETPAPMRSRGPRSVTACSHAFSWPTQRDGRADL